MLRVPCPACRRIVETAEESQGSFVKCPCGQSVFVPICSDPQWSGFLWSLAGFFLGFIIGLFVRYHLPKPETSQGFNDVGFILFWLCVIAGTIAGAIFGVKRGKKNKPSE